MDEVVRIDGVVTLADGTRRAFQVSPEQWRVWDGQAQPSGAVDQVVQALAEGLV